MEMTTCVERRRWRDEDELRVLADRGQQHRVMAHQLDRLEHKLERQRARGKAKEVRAIERAATERAESNAIQAELAAAREQIAAFKSELLGARKQMAALRKLAED